MDIDHDNVLNILNLLHIHKYLRPRTLLQREIITLIDEYLHENIFNKSQKMARVEVDFEYFHKFYTSSCIRNEIRRKFWNINEPYEPNEPHSMCQPMEGE